jgi:hypothetical protein
VERAVRALAALFAAIAVAALSCGGGTPSGTQPVPNHDAPTSSVIGQDGGSVSTPGGASVTIPAGALTASLTVTVTPSSAPGPSGTTMVGPQYDLGPDGTTFAKPATVTLAFDPARIPAGKSAKDVVVYTSSGGSSSFTRLPTTPVDATHVSATTTHFSSVGPAVPEPAPGGYKTAAQRAVACQHGATTSDPFDPAPTLRDDGTAEPWTPKDPKVLTEWDPTQTNFCRPAFCNGYPGHVMVDTNSPTPLSRMARYRLDEGCQRHLPATGGDRLCTKGSGPSFSSVKATACVDIEYVMGTAAATPTKLREEDVICVQCPDKSVRPKEGTPCEQGQLDLAKAQYPIFNVRDGNVRKAEAWYKAGKATSNGGSPAAWIAFLNAVRVLAPEIGYCEGTPAVSGKPEAAYMTETPGSSWRYADYRWDLNRELVWAGNSQTMANVPDFNQFVVGQSGLEAGPTNNKSFDLDGMVLALWHEMRHMGTRNFGGGEVGGGDENVASTEHMLNELEDYSLMQVYPWFDTIPAYKQASYFSPDGNTGGFDLGWKSSRSCFSWEWGLPSDDSSGFDGYPPDKRNLGQKLALTAHEQWDGKPVPVGSGECGSGHLLTPKVPPNDSPSSSEAERCAVATWAVNRSWMFQRMLSSINLGQTSPLMPGGGFLPMMPGLPGGLMPLTPLRPPLAQPPKPDQATLDGAVWNILAHWVLGFPARNGPYCSSRTVPQ